jgi:hypothetical protein
MALRTTERRIDLVVANQAIRHLREIALGDVIQFLHAAVARLASILRVQVRSEITRLR